VAQQRGGGIDEMEHKAEGRKACGRLAEMLLDVKVGGAECFGVREGGGMQRAERWVTV